MTSTIQYCDLKTAKNGKNYYVVTFEDGTKGTVWETDQAKNRCPFWDALHVGAHGEYTTRMNGQFTDITGFAPSSDSPATGIASPAQNLSSDRNRSIIIQSCLKCAVEIVNGLIIAKKLEGPVETVAWETACAFYEKITGEAFDDPFA